MLQVDVMKARMEEVPVDPTEMATAIMEASMEAIMEEAQADTTSAITAVITAITAMVAEVGTVGVMAMVTMEMGEEEVDMVIITEMAVI